MWSLVGGWIAFRRTDERSWSNKEQMLKMYSDKPADKRPVRVIEPDGTAATLLDPGAFRWPSMAIDGRRANWKPVEK